jgi:hypothetical protein
MERINWRFGNFYSGVFGYFSRSVYRILQRTSSKPDAYEQISYLCSRVNSFWKCFISALKH